jgi:hypothetical protein
MTKNGRPAASGSHFAVVHRWWDLGGSGVLVFSSGSVSSGNSGGLARVQPRKAAAG